MTDHPAPAALAERPNLSAACGAWRHGDGSLAHDHCTGRVALPAPLDRCGCLCHRPRELTYDHLDPGVEGYWPVIGARPDELRPGDRLHFPGDELGDVVVEVEREAGRGWPCRLGYVTADGRRLSIGRMAEGFRLDRWGTSAKLGRYVR